MHRIPIALAVLAAFLGGVVGIRASGPGLCGLTHVTDRLLGCRPPAAAPAGSSHTATTQQAPAQSASSAATVARTGPVIRTATAAQYVPATAVVRFADGASAAQIHDALVEVHGTQERTIASLHAVVVKVPDGTLAAALAKLNRSGLVAAATRDEVLHVLATPNDANYGLQWGLPKAGFPQAWARTRGKRSVVVAVLDTGVNGTVPDLAGNVKPGLDLTGTGLTDVDGHGTAVAGVIAAHANNAIGGAGVCPNCTILPIKVMNNDGHGDLATVAQGIVKAADLHAKVIDLSLGGPVGLDALKQAVDYATHKGALVVAAAGNSGKGTPFYPANYPNVIGVAGTNQVDRLYTWSERGTWVQVAAPGCNVAPLTKGGYGMFCGTSSATPLVAGLAALAASYKPGAGAARIAHAIEATAHKIGPIAGHGRIDAPAALAALH
jgi:subtilisin family serine protease